ncbi:MAG: bifunctional UDP-N-acetylglucosamine diphosphorylase/glucosamine-1-phosphate N-acetyltransferase GlmU [Chloroflexota bacterium]
MRSSENSEPPSPNDRIGVVILAAGQGTRMRSDLPKLLHPVAGLPLVRQAVLSTRVLSPVATVVVVGHEADRVAAAAGPDVETALQVPQLGTAHALAQARAALRSRVDIVVMMYGDSVLVGEDTFKRLVAGATHHPLSFLSIELDDPAAYGRVVRDGSGAVCAIVERADATAEEVAIREVYVGGMAFRADWMWDRLDGLPTHASGEQYITDLVRIAHQEGLTATAVPVANADEFGGVNTQAELAAANRVLWDRARARLMAAGVRMVDPSTVYIDTTVTVESNAVIEPNTHLRGATHVGNGSVIGPNSIITDTRIGRDCQVIASVLESSEIGDRVTVGPFAHLRPGANVGDDVELGNYAEVKGSTLGARTKMHHFGYIGDADVATDVNIGAGTITCNYDGEHKHRTVVGEGAFIGSDTMLIAPITIGERAYTGAGSVVTRDVAPGTSVRGVPARVAEPVRAETAPAEGSDHG